MHPLRQIQFLALLPRLTEEGGVDEVIENLKKRGITKIEIPSGPKELMSVTASQAAPLKPRANVFKARNELPDQSNGPSDIGTDVRNPVLV